MTIDINGDVINSITIDGQSVTEVTADGEIVFTLPPIPSFTNNSFENFTNDGTANRPDDWEFFDSTNTSNDSGIFRVNDRFSTDGVYSLENGYTTNSFGNENRIQQDIDITNINTITLDRRGIANSTRSELLIRVDGVNAANLGVMPSDGNTDTVSGDVSSFSGVSTVAFVWNQVSGDNLGTSAIDFIRTS